MKTAPLIAIEGIDGSGKGTQARLLMERLAARGRKASLFSFPGYQKTLGGGLVADYLNGRLGEAKQIDSRLAAVLFALDRFEQKETLLAARKKGHIVLCDRYVASNLAHQVARTRPALKPKVRALIETLEYEVLALPRPDLIVYLDMPDTLARKRVHQKGARDYTKKALDAHEADKGHERAARAEYLRLAKRPEWTVIRTVSPRGPLPPEAIADQVWEALLDRKLLSRA